MSCYLDSLNRFEAIMKYHLIVATSFVWNIMQCYNILLDITQSYYGYCEWLRFWFVKIIVLVRNYIIV